MVIWCTGGNMYNLFDYISNVWTIKNNENVWSFSVNCFSLSFVIMRDFNLLRMKQYLSRRSTKHWRAILLYEGFNISWKFFQITFAFDIFICTARVLMLKSISALVSYIYFECNIMYKMLLVYYILHIPYLCFHYTKSN